jgi:hypothetical protein
VIRHELTVGQQRDLVRALKTKDGDVDTTAYPLARALAYLVSWSFIDERGGVAPITQGAIEFLDTATFSEITAAIDGHVDALEQEKKRTTSTATAADPTLQSVGS